MKDAIGQYINGVKLRLTSPFVNPEAAAKDWVKGSLINFAISFAGIIAIFIISAFTHNILTSFLIVMIPIAVYVLIFAWQGWSKGARITLAVGIVAILIFAVITLLNIPK